MEFKAPFNNNSVFLEEENGVPRITTDLPQVSDKHYTVMRTHTTMAEQKGKKMIAIT